MKKIKKSKQTIKKQARKNKEETAVTQKPSEIIYSVTLVNGNIATTPSDLQRLALD